MTSAPSRPTRADGNEGAAKPRHVEPERDATGHANVSADLPSAPPREPARHAPAAAPQAGNLPSGADEEATEASVGGDHADDRPGPSQGELPARPMPHPAPPHAPVASEPAPAPRSPGVPPNDNLQG